MEEHDIGLSKKPKTVKKNQPNRGKIILIISVWIIAIVGVLVPFLLKSNCDKKDKESVDNHGLLQLDTTFVTNHKTVNIHIDEAFYDVSNCNTISISVEDGKLIVTNQD